MTKLGAPVGALILFLKDDGAITCRENNENAYFVTIPKGTISIITSDYARGIKHIEAVWFETIVNDEVVASCWNPNTHRIVSEC